jgi:hypothetical protein
MHVQTLLYCYSAVGLLVHDNGRRLVRHGCGSMATVFAAADRMRRRVPELIKAVLEKL